MNKLKRLLPAFLLSVVAFAAMFAFACSNKTTYTVSFESNGGSAVASQSVVEGNTATKPTDPTYEGYTFSGWYSQGVEYDFSTTVTSNVTLVAQWTINSYTVTFDTDGGSTVSSQTVKYGYTATQPAMPTKTGYTFEGWYNGTIEYDFSTSVTSNITLTAQWTANTYTVTFDANGGSLVASQTIAYGERATEPSTYGWYEFLGWYDEDGNLYDFDTAITSDITLYAQWDEDKESEVMIVGMTIDTLAVKTEYVIGEGLDTFGISLTLTVRNSVDDSEYETSVTGGIGNVIIDSSEFDNTTAGTYTIYVGYVISDITRWASYDVTVTSVISGTHGIEITKTTTNYYLVQTGEEETVIDLSDIKVYSVNSDGTQGDEITTGITYKYFEGSKEISASDITNGNVTYYQVWAYVNYTEGNETYVMSDFVLIQIIGDEITELELASGTVSQAQSFTDIISSTWTFAATYSLSGEATIKLSDCSVGTDVGQYTVDIKTSVTGSHTATVTYYYQLGNKVVSASCDVDYIISIATTETSYNKIIDVSNSTNQDYDVDTVTPDVTITTQLSDGDTIIDNLVYAYGTLKISSENKTLYNTETGEDSKTNKLYDRIQIGTSAGLTLYLGGATTITLYARYGSSGAGAAYVLKDSSGNTVATSATIATSAYQIVSLSVESEGIYILTATGSLNTFRIVISGNIGKDYTILSYNPNTLTESDVTSSLGENKALDSTFTLCAGKNTVKIEDKTSTPVTVGDMTFNYAINLGGAKKTNGDADERCVSFTVTEDMLANGSVILTVYANHTGTATDTRTLGVYTTGNTGSNYAYSGSVLGSGSIVTIEITEAGTYYMGSASNGMCLYYMSLAYIATATEVA